jgi:hypothetical protein
MARSSKPRKAYNPNKHRMHVPMTAQTRDGLALQLHMTVEAMAATPSEALGGKLARILAAMANAINYQSPKLIRDRKDPDALAVVGALKALEAIEERFDRLGKYGVSGDEITALRAAAGGLDESLARIPFNVLQASIHAANRACG